MADETISITGLADLEPAPVRISDELGARIVSSMRAAYDQALADRSDLDEGILIAERNWEMITVERTYPWKGASNVFIPIIPEQVINVVAATKADVFTPGGFFLLVGKDEKAQERVHDVQRYYNAKLTDSQGMNYRTWLQEAEDWLGLSTLHGTAYLDVTYLRKKSMRKYVSYEDQVDPQTGEPVLDKDGDPVSDETMHEVEFTDYEGVLWEALELREVVLIPARAKGITEALHTGGVARILYLTEADLMQMSAPVKRGKPLLDREKVEYLLKSSIAKGDSERNQDPRGMETYDVGGQISPNSQVFSDDVMGKLTVTEYEVLRIESNAIDLNGDGSGEHMIYYIHRQPEILLGAIAFPYHHNQRLTIELSLMRRYKRAYGFGVPERLRTIQVEYNANFNMGNDQNNLRLAPPRYQEEGVKVLGTDNGEWGPNVTFVGPKGAVGVLELPDILPSNAEIRSELGEMASRISNQNPPQATGSRVTKAGVAAAQAKQNAYQNTMSENLRYALAAAFHLTMELDKQYGPHEMTAIVKPQAKGGKPETATITKEDLMLHYQQLVNGMGGPQDPAQDRSDRMTLHQMFASRPDFINDPPRMYQLDEFVLEAFPMADKTTLIGSPEDAKKRQEAQQQAQAEQKKEQQALAQAKIFHDTGGVQGQAPPPGAQPPGGPPGAPPGGPPGAAPPQGPPQ
jgi:hypothetical protein